MIAAGFGFRARATAESLEDALRRAVDGARIDLIAAPAGKTSHPGLVALAQDLGMPVAAVEAADLAAQHTATRSAAALAAYSTGSVAEAAALAAAGPGAQLLGARAVSADRLATCALAEGTGP